MSLSFVQLIVTFFATLVVNNQLTWRTPGDSFTQAGNEKIKSLYPILNTF